MKVFRRSCWRGMGTGERSMGLLSSFWGCLGGGGGGFCLEACFLGVFFGGGFFGGMFSILFGLLVRDVVDRRVMMDDGFSRAGIL